MNPIAWHPHARRNVLLWTIVPATLALAALGGLSLAFAGLPLIALLLVAGYVAFVWFAGHQRLMRQIRAVPTCLPAIVGPIHELCAQGAIPVPELYLSPDPSPNAFAITTRNGSAICVTRGLLETIDQRELRAVLGHELAHLRNRDSVFSLLFMTVTSAITITMITFGALVALAMLARDDGKRRTSSAGAIATGLAIGTLGLLVARLLFAGATRVRERLADHDGAHLSRDPIALATALEKMEAAAAGRPMALPATAGAVAAFCIINPVDALLSTHPSTIHRVFWLKQIAAQQEGSQ